MKMLLSNLLVFLNALSPLAVAHPGHRGDVDTLAVAFVFMLLGILLAALSAIRIARRSRRRRPARPMY